MANPIQIRENHRVIALLLAMGWKNVDISREFGMAENRISILRNTPTMKMLIQSEQRRLIDRVHQGFVESAVPFEQWSESEEDASRKRWKELRDQDGFPAVALKAIEMTWDRRYPKKQFREEEKTIRVVIEGQDFSQLAKAIAEDKEGSVELEDGEVIEAKVSNDTNGDGDVNGNGKGNGAVNGKVIRPVMPEEIED